MNIYVRYFDHEAITHNIEELIDFLAKLNEIPITRTLVDELTVYVNSEMPYPKRYKVRPRVYFILIKTSAQTLDEFKANRKSHDTPLAYSAENQTQREPRTTQLQEVRKGWYFGRINFKRVLLIPGTQKYQYRDTTFSAYVLADSAQHCYTRIIDHLKNRQDVDPRSQFPSAKGTNFNYEYMGEKLRQE
ncbi:hypothetical protein EII14_08155 [Alloprevotella sp. OH1205_COT-284]|uniref:hypothetical protein n=1 Tax=Alloprevotella sp. OH1205_COT-284 TaxID=2491043 RepID=UPI000F5DBE09|nr:hypothetical protein [Alloprevotella sp. OH1205_COT-284]RRD76194.1 hypothetical protein EII14_08155 [Alloprevotella sp. OH1205_COT-284]